MSEPPKGMAPTPIPLDFDYAGAALRFSERNLTERDSTRTTILSFLADVRRQVDALRTALTTERARVKELEGVLRQICDLGDGTRISVVALAENALATPSTEGHPTSGPETP